MATTDIIKKATQSVSFLDTDYTTSRTTGGRNIDTGSYCDINEILEIYVQDLMGENERKKASDKKVRELENLLTKDGLEKLFVARSKIRSIVRSIKRQEEQNAPVLYINKWESEELQQMSKIGDSGIECYFLQIQEWGKYPENDARYYLHMVFRYYLYQYHKEAVNRNLIIEYPSYQNILDTVIPNGCKSGFPPEFSRFLDDSGGRKVPIYTLPVPHKGCGKKASFEINFEKNEEVSIVRRIIYSKFREWLSDLNLDKCIYPHFLHRGNDENQEIQLGFNRMKETERIRSDMHLIINIDESKLEKLVKDCPEFKNLHKKYVEYNFVTQGEQLRERFGFFLINRQLFSVLGKYKLMEELFGGKRMDIFTYFSTFCTKNKSISTIEKDESICRELVVLLTEVAYKIHIFCNKDMGSNRIPIVEKWYQNNSEIVT